MADLADSLRPLGSSLVVFDTAVVDLTEKLSDPVEIVVLLALSDDGAFMGLSCRPHCAGAALTLPSSGFAIGSGEAGLGPSTGTGEPAYALPHAAISEALRQRATCLFPSAVCARPLGQSVPGPRVCG